MGKSRIFWDLDEFGAVAVAGLGNHSPCEPLEELDVLRENARIAAGGEYSKFYSIATFFKYFILKNVNRPKPIFFVVFGI